MQKNPYARALIFGGCALSTLTFLVIDLLSKERWFDQAFDRPIPQFSFFSGWIQHTFHANHGAIANIPVPLPLLLALSLGVCGLILQALWKAPLRTIRVPHIFATGLLLGGALGNIYDRALFGFVRDWILLGGRSAMNIADISVLLGAAFFAITLSRQPASFMKRGKT